MIFYKDIFKSIDRSIFASYGTHSLNYFVSLGIVMRQEPRTQPARHFRVQAPSPKN